MLKEGSIYDDPKTPYEEEDQMQINNDQVIL
jgi:hypothetical protein